MPANAARVSSFVGEMNSANRKITVAEPRSFEIDRSRFSILQYLVSANFRMNVDPPQECDRQESRRICDDNFVILTFENSEP